MKERLEKAGRFLKTHKKQITAAAVILIVLAGAFWFGGNAPGLQGLKDDGASMDARGSAAVSSAVLPEMSAQAPDTSASSGAASSAATPPADSQAAQPPAENQPEAPGDEKTQAGSKIEERPGGAQGGMSASEKVQAAADIAGGSSPDVPAGDEQYSEQQGMILNDATGKDKYQTDPVPEGKPVPVEPQDAVITDQALSCTLSVRCDTILDNIGWLDPDKVELVPDDGVIFPETQVTFYEGESVFNVLQREMKKAKIQMEFENTPMYNSAYIEGIHNLYEFDCGDLSGWMYKVNGWFPNYGCSRYQLQDGDKIEWVYTCDLGKDVGGYSAAGG